MNGRVYDPILARFLSPDPYVQLPGYANNFNRYSYALNNPLILTDPDGEWVHLVLGAIIGGYLNLVMNADKVENIWQALGYFGIGAVTGALSAGVGMGVTASLSGASFGAGFIGSQTAISAISSSFATSFLSGAAVGGVTGFTSGFGVGTGNAWMGGESFGQGLWSGTKAGIWGGFKSALLGGISSGVAASLDDRDFWTGSQIKKEVVFDQSDILPRTVQEGTNNCLPATGENVARSYGRDIDQLTIRNDLFPGTSAETDMLPDKTFWNRYSNKYFFTIKGEEFSPTSIDEITRVMNNGGRVTVGIEDHHVELASLRIKAIYRPNGTKIKFIWKAMDNGILSRVYSTNFGNIFYIYQNEQAFNNVFMNINSIIW